MQEMIPGLGEGMRHRGQLLERALEGDVVVVREDWPNSGTDYAVKAGAARLGVDTEASRVEELVGELRILEEMETAPIVGVFGSMNGGKSSFVASLLSAQGANRVARGAMNAEATNRFVFWLPAKWDDRNSDDRGVIWKSIEEQLTGVFGSTLEYLPVDPAEAKRMTSNADRSNFSIPLIAFDARLDELNCCLLDAPDVESRMGDQSADDRLQMVERSLGVCHAVLYVVRSDGVRSDQIAKLGTLLKGQLKNRTIFLAINKVRHSDASLASRIQADDVQLLVQALSVDKIFAAYDFEARSNDGALPEAAARAIGLDTGFPWFFDVLDHDAGNAPDSVNPDRFLVEQFRHLDAHALWEQAIDDKLQEIREALDRARDVFGVTCAQHQETLREQTRQLIDFVTDQMTDEGKAGGRELKIPFSPVVMRELSESFLRTAPIYARPALWMNRSTADLAKWMRATGRAASNLIRPDRVAADAAISAAKEHLHKEEGESFLRAKDFANRALERGMDFVGASKEEIVKAWEIVVGQMVGRANEFGKQESERDALDTETRAIWRSLPLPSKLTLGVAGIVVSIAGLMAALLAVIDLGVTAVILTTSTAKLLTILGVGGAAALGGGLGGVAAAGKLDSLLRKRVAVPAYCRTVAATCDVFGLPRAAVTPLKINFEGSPKSRLQLSEVEFPTVQTALPLNNLILATSNPIGWNQLFRMLEGTRAE